MTSTHRLKLWICIACLASSMAAPAYEPNLGISMDLIDLAAISRMTPQQLEVLAEGLAAQEFMRTKRSSAAALTAAVASKASSSSGLQSKVGLLGQASAGAVSFISSASSKSGHGDDHPGYSYEPQESKVDFWGLKKSILYTLFQAVKAITGGVTILKGQLIKGGGALASTLGKVIKVKGEAVSNFGKKIVNSAALSHKPAATIHHHHHPAPVYGPPSPPHLDYPPSSYGAPTAPAHFAHAPPSGPPSGFSAHKYPSQLDGEDEDTIHEIIPIEFPHIGRAKLNGVHAGLVILAPLGEEQAASAHAGSTPLEPPPSILNSAFSAIKNVFSAAATGPATSAAHASPPTYGPPSASASYAPIPTAPNHDIIDQPPPPPQPYKTWGAVNSYGEPAMVDAYPDYDPRNPHQTFDRHSSVPKHPSIRQSHGLTSEKLNKISDNLEKLARLTAQQRSSEEVPHFDSLDVYRKMLMQGMKIPLLPTPVITDAQLVLPESNHNQVVEDETFSSTTTTTSTTTTARPMTDEKTRRRKDIKYILKGNRIVQRYQYMKGA